MTQHTHDRQLVGFMTNGTVTDGIYVCLGCPDVSYGTEITGTPIDPLERSLSAQCPDRSQGNQGPCFGLRSRTLPGKPWERAFALAFPGQFGDIPGS